MKKYTILALLLLNGFVANSWATSDPINVNITITAELKHATCEITGGNDINIDMGTHHINTIIPSMGGSRDINGTSRQIQLMCPPAAGLNYRITGQLYGASGDSHTLANISSRNPRASGVGVRLYYCSSATNCKNTPETINANDALLSSAKSGSAITRADRSFYIKPVLWNVANNDSVTVGHVEAQATFVITYR